jgi:Ca-activated chloride channel family protein
VIVLDVSRSMLAEDVLPNRLERAKKALEELSYTVQERGGHRLALVACAARARLICPLTHDYDHFRTALAELDAANLPPDLRPGGPDAPSGTRIGAALRAAVEAQDARFGGYQDIILLSDGDDPARDQEWREGVDAARDRRIPVHTVGVGNPDVGSPIPVRAGEPLRHQSDVVLTRLEEQPLRTIAEGTAGTYTPARTDTFHLGELFRTHIEARPPHENPDDALPVYRLRYPWFLGSGLLFLVLEMGLGSRQKDKRKRNVSEAQPLRTWILLASSFFLFPWLFGAVSSEKAEELVRRGNAAFGQADFAAAVDSYNRAEETAIDPGLVAYNKATALYQLGRYREAELHYRYAREEAAGLRRARLLYNLGNCILQQAQDRDARRVKVAMGLYQECMQQEAADSALIADARHNLELARLLFQKAGAQQHSEQGNDEEQPKDPNDDGARDDSPRAATMDARGKGEPVRGVPGDPGATPTSTEQTPPPGKGNLPTLPDTDDLLPLSSEDAAQHLKQAAARILREHQEQLRQKAPVIPSNVKDW